MYQEAKDLIALWDTGVLPQGTLAARRDEIGLRRAESELVERIVRHYASNSNRT